MNLTTLKTELTNDPLTRGYAGMSDEAIANSLNTANRTVNRETVDGGTLMASLVVTELVALTARQQDYVLALCQVAAVPWIPNLKTQIGSLFGAGTATRANFIALQNRIGSRAEELSLGETVTPSHVADAKRLP